MKIQEIIVVEGKDDTVAVQRAVQADTIETGGSAINKEKLERIRLAQERRGVIIFTDPDYPGEKIRKTIDQYVPGCKHAFLSKEKAKSAKGKYGIEHATPENIREALSKVRGAKNSQSKDQQDQKNNGQSEGLQLKMQDLQQLGLIGSSNSQALRESITKKLGIGYCNGKQLMKRIEAFRIQPLEFEQAYQEALKEVQK